MAAKKTGHDPATAAIIEVLERIEKQAVATNQRLERVEQELHAFREETREDLGAVRADVSSLRTEVTSLRAETRADLALHHEEMRIRVRKLEEAVFRSPTPPTREVPKRRAG